MKFTIRIEEQSFEVEVGDVHVRPVMAVVDGETFEVWPEEEATKLPVAEKPVSPAQPPASAKPVAAAAPKAGSPAPAAGASVVTAPIPGVITKIQVQAGAEVKRGAELCNLEAMKMNNTIRAPRDGKIAAIHVSVGQQVKHGEALLEYAA